MMFSLRWEVTLDRALFMFVVHRVIQQMLRCTTYDWKIAKRFSRYLKGTRMLELQIGGVGVSSGDVKIESWSDANYTADKS